MPLTVALALTVMIFAAALDAAFCHHCVLTLACPQPDWTSTRYRPVGRSASVYSPPADTVNTGGSPLASGTALTHTPLSGEVDVPVTEPVIVPLAGRTALMALTVWSAATLMSVAEPLPAAPSYHWVPRSTASAAQVGSPTSTLYLPGVRPVKPYWPWASVDVSSARPPGIWNASTQAPGTAAVSAVVTRPAIAPPARSAALTPALTFPCAT